MVNENGFAEFNSGWEEIGRDSKIKISTDPIDYKNFYYFNNNILFIANAEGVITHINDSWKEILGYLPEEIIGKKITEIIADDEKDDIETLIEGLTPEKNKISFKCYLMSNNLSLKYTDWSITFHDNILYGFIKDISETNELQEQVSQSEERLRTVLEFIPKQVYWKDVRSRYLGCNVEFAKTAGFDNPSDVIGKNDYELPWAKTADEYIFHDREIMQLGEPQYDIERQLTFDDKNIWLKLNKIPLKDRAGRTFGLLGIIEDITRQKNEYELQKESEIKFRSLFENSYDAICVISKEGSNVYVNNAFINLFGYSSRKEIMKLPPLGVICEEDRRTVEELYNSRCTNNMQPNNYNVTGLKKDGSKFVLNITASTFEMNSNEFTLAILRDITENKNIEDKLRDSEITLHALFDSITEFAVLVDLDGNITMANETAAKLFDSVPDEMTGRNIFDLIDYQHREKEKDVFKKIIKTKNSINFVETVGNIVNDITIYPIFNRADEVSSFVIIRVDITMQQNAHEALRQRDAMLSALINATTESAMLLDSNGKILMANETVAKRFNMTIEEFIGQYLFDLMSIKGAEDRKRHMEYVVNTGIPIRFEENRDDQIFDNSIYPVFDKEGKVIQLAVFASDITKRKKAEEEIKQMNNKLLESNSTKDKFFSIISHDMRSPFQGLLGFSQILLDEYDELTEEEKKHYITNIREISKNSFKLLENLLQWSRLQTGNFEFNPKVFNIAEEIEPTLLLLKNTAQNKEIAVESFIKPRAHIMADKNMLNTIVRNLVSNAIKFTNPGGKISLFSNELNDAIVFTVKDDGIGMSQEKLEMLFKPVKNISTLGTANERGTGIGLLLCKEMIEKHNGEIWVESEEGKGTSFHFTMPVLV